MKIVKNNGSWLIISLLISCLLYNLIFFITKDYLHYQDYNKLILFLSTSITTFSLGKICFTRYHLVYNYLFYFGYSLLIYLTLFCRIGEYSGINLNLFIYNEFDISNLPALIFTIFNLFIFMPFGFIKYRTKTMNFLSFIIFIVIAIAIEYLQLYLHVGVFDISDIILYIAGFIIGRVIRNCYLRIIKRKF